MDVGRSIVDVAARDLDKATCWGLIGPYILP